MDKTLNTLTDQELERVNGGTGKRSGAMLIDTCIDITEKAACIEAKCTWENDHCKPAATTRSII